MGSCWYAGKAGKRNREEKEETIVGSQGQEQKEVGEGKCRSIGEHKKKTRRGERPRVRP